jgi:hypothetical protein
MRITRALFGRLLPVFALIAAAWPLAGGAQTNEVDPEAVKLLRRATDYLSALKQFRVETDTSLEAVISTGQKLQFGHRVTLTVQRPNKLRAERVGELVSQTFYYDGKSLSVNLPDLKFHAVEAAPPTIEAMLDFARGKLNVIAPAADLVYQNAFERFSEGLTSALIIGEAMVGGARCVHVAFRNPEVDWQIWIQDGDKPLPRKFVITSKKMPQSPQFTVVLSKWDAAPKVTDGLFRFMPPKGSQKIDFLPAAAPARK